MRRIKLLHLRCAWGWLYAYSEPIELPRTTAKVCSEAQGEMTLHWCRAWVHAHEKKKQLDDTFQQRGIVPSKTANRSRDRDHDRSRDRDRDRDRERDRERERERERDRYRSHRGRDEERSRDRDRDRRSSRRYNLTCPTFVWEFVSGSLPEVRIWVPLKSLW